MLRGPNPWTTGSALLARLEVPAGLGFRSFRQVLEHCRSAVDPGMDLEPIGMHVDGPGVWTVVLPIDEEAIGRACLNAAVEALAVGSEPATEGLLTIAQEVRPGPSTASLRAEALARGIPVRRLGEATSLLVLGHGARQRRLWAAETDRTSAIAQGIAQDKALTRSLLAEVGVPVPEGRTVADVDEAIAAAQGLGWPVVVKPNAGRQGLGVSLNVGDEAGVREAFARAWAVGMGGVRVERQVRGEDYRLLVVNGRLVAAARRDPPLVVGDGVQCVAQLIQALNDDPRRAAVDHAGLLSRVDSGDPAVRDELLRQGLGLDSAPELGRVVRLRANGNLSTGGSAVDVTDGVHPEVAARAVEAARAVGLDVAGIDVIAADIGRPLEPDNGAVIEVNAGPGLRMHLAPSEGTPRPVARAIVETLFEPGHTGRIPTVGVTGVNGKTTTARLVAAILAGAGHHVGLTCTDGIRIGSRWIAREDCSGPQSARAVLVHPSVDAAVLETARGGILREGLGFDRCDVAIVTNMGEGDHLGQAGIESLEALAEVKRVLVRHARWAVLNAADPLVAAMDGSAGEGTVFFSADGTDAPLAARHRRRGGRMATVQAGRIVLEGGGETLDLGALADIPLTHGGRAVFQVENVLAAAAAAWLLGIEANTIRSALAAFPAGPEGSPGRFNVSIRGGVTIVVDYAHNPSGLQALARALDGLTAQEGARRTIVYSAVGDRRDRDITRQGQVLARAFERVVIYEDTYNRGRPPGQVTELLRQGIESEARGTEVHAATGGLEAARLAHGLVGAGELLVIQPNDVEATIAWVEGLGPVDGPDDSSPPGS
jgi:cyanophycin synthetase